MRHKHTLVAAGCGIVLSGAFSAVAVHAQRSAHVVTPNTSMTTFVVRDSVPADTTKKPAPDTTTPPKDTTKKTAPKK